MEKIASFTIDHVRLVPGVYVSRKDPVGGTIVTTFDIRITSPNDEPVMNTAELHAMEHLAPEPSGIRAEDRLFRTHGLQDRLLPAAERRL